jgi:hypothetical protein
VISQQSTADIGCPLEIENRYKQRLPDKIEFGEAIRLKSLRNR